MQILGRSLPILQDSSHVHVPWPVKGHMQSLKRLMVSEPLPYIEQQKGTCRSLNHFTEFPRQALASGEGGTAFQGCRQELESFDRFWSQGFGAKGLEPRGPTCSRGACTTATDATPAARSAAASFARLRQGGPADSCTLS